MTQKICLMLQTTNNRIFFTHKKHGKEIKTFAKKMNIDMYVAKTNSFNVKTLNELVKLYCDQNYVTPNEHHEIIEKYSPKIQEKKSL